MLLDGIDVREFQLRALRQQVAMVLQQPIVFPTTVRENIAYGQPDASAAQIAAAARLAQLDDFLARLPEGLDTADRRVGRDAVGWRAAPHHDRARHPARRAAADSRRADRGARRETEARVLAGLEQLMEGRTTLRDRASAVDGATRRRDPGARSRAASLEQGSFDELVARGGHFARLHQTQFGLGEEERAATS